MAFTTITAAEVDPNSPGDQALMDKIRLNFDDHEARILGFEAAANESIRTHFCVTALDTNIWATGGDAPSFNMATNGEHVIRVLGQSASFCIIASATNKMHFRLNKDMVVVMEWRVIEAGIDNPDNILIGFQDASLGLVVGSVADQSDMIGFIKGSTSKQYKFRTAKAGVATETDNIGSRDSWHTLKLTLTKSGATLSVAALFDAVAISGSPFTTNIPDTVVLRPFIGVDATASNSASHDVDFLDAFWSGKPANIG